MNSEYESIIDFGNMVGSGIPYLVHAGIVTLHLSLAGFLLSTGVLGSSRPKLDGPWIRKLGVANIGEPRTRIFAGIRILLGLMLLAPVALGAPSAVSIAGGFAAFAVLVLLEGRIPESEKTPGRVIRRSAIVFAALASLFMLWEGEDNLELGSELLLRSLEWRSDEIAWQQQLDPKSPKVGDLAPDFELQDPDGKGRVRLSEFRGKRPVALLFGSYT
jgi:hypothetical protein